MKATVNSPKNQTSLQTPQSNKIRIRWMARRLKTQQHLQTVSDQDSDKEPTQALSLALAKELKAAQRLNQLRHNQLSALVSERWQLAQAKQELQLKHRSLRRAQTQLLKARLSSWLKSFKQLSLPKFPSLRKSAKGPLQKQLSKLTPIGQGILIWGFSGMAVFGLGMLIVRLRRRAAEQQALQDMQQDNQLSVARPLTAAAVKTPNKLWR